MPRNKLFSLLLLALCPLLLAGCNSARRFEAEFLSLFDTYTTVIGYANSKSEFEAMANSIQGELGRYHRLYDIYNEYPGLNNLKTVNDNAGLAPVTVDGDIISLLLFAKEQSRQSGGKMNPAMGAVLSIWHEYRTEGAEDFENAKLPPRTLLEEAARHISFDDVIIDETASTVYLADEALRLDVGSVAKGYATEQVCRMLEREGYASVLLSVGGNVRAVGDRNGEPWNVGIQNPDTGSEETILHHINLQSASMVTSGVYQRYYTVDGKQYHHIIDPATLYPAETYASVTVVCPDSGIADTLSTTLFLSSLEEGQALVASMPETEALWVLSDGTQKQSGGFSALLR